MGRGEVTDVWKWKETSVGNWGWKVRGRGGGKKRELRLLRLEGESRPELGGAERAQGRPGVKKGQLSQSLAQGGGWRWGSGKMEVHWKT